MKRDHQNILLNDLVHQVSKSILLIKNTRDKMLDNEVFDKKVFKNLMDGFDVGTRYLYVLYMIRSLSDENRGEYFNQESKTFSEITKFCATVTSMKKNNNSKIYFFTSEVNNISH